MTNFSQIKKLQLAIKLFLRAYGYSESSAYFDTHNVIETKKHCMHTLPILTSIMFAILRQFLSPIMLFQVYGQLEKLPIMYVCTLLRYVTTQTLA